MHNLAQAERDVRAHRPLRSVLRVGLLLAVAVALLVLTSLATMVSSQAGTFGVPLSCVDFWIVLPFLVDPEAPPTLAQLRQEHLVPGQFGTASRAGWYWIWCSPNDAFLFSPSRAAFDMMISFGVVYCVYCARVLHRRRSKLADSRPPGM
jgi:hypothetical protein